jgi:hypothetical protein
MLRIRRRLSTAHHPETDGQTERMIATIKEFLRNFCNRLQDNWAELAPAAQLAINSRDAASTGISPFFLDHGYHLELLELNEGIPEESLGRTPKEKAEKIITKLQGALDIALTELAAAQDTMEGTANRRRAPAPEYKTSDLVWLDLRNVRTERPSKTLDNCHAKYRVLEKVGSTCPRVYIMSSILPFFGPQATTPSPANGMMITNRRPKLSKANQNIR